jgi:hypothetical protein
MTMSLLEAFRLLGPVGDDPAEDAGREEAARVLLAEVQSICRRMRSFREGDLEDASGELMKRLVRRGPRGIRPYDPASDSEVRPWLRRALKNNALDILDRRDERETVEDLSRVTGGDSPEDALLAARGREALDAAYGDLQAIVAAISRERRTEEEQSLFAADVAVMIDIASGARTFDAVVAAEVAKEAPAAEPAALQKRVRDRFYQRFRNRLLALHRAAQEREVDGSLTAERAAGVRRVIGHLQLREARKR